MGGATQFLHGRAGHSKITAIVSMFSFHYFAKNPLVYDLFDLVAPKGLVLMAILDKTNVETILGDADHFKQGIYEYRKEPASPLISIKLPFSDELY